MNNDINNANLLLQIGEAMYNKTKNLILFGPVGLGCLLITMICCGEYATRYLVFSGAYAFVNMLVGFWYLMIAIGVCVVPPYFMGLILIGIGQIAKNTDPSNNNNSSNISEELPDL